MRACYQRVTRFRNNTESNPRIFSLTPLLPQFDSSSSPPLLPTGSMVIQLVLPAFAILCNQNPPALQVPNPPHSILASIHATGKHVVFGEVIDGMDLIRLLSNAPFCILNVSQWFHQENREREDRAR
jgi:hypothetical protein